MKIQHLYFILFIGGYLFLTACKQTVSTKLVHDINKVFVEQHQNQITSQYIAKLQQLSTHSSTEKQVLDVVSKVKEAQLLASSENSIQEVTELIFKSADSLVQKIEFLPLTIWTNTQLGYYYYRMSQLERALPYFLQSSRHLLRIPMDNLIDPSDCLLKNAYFFGNIGDHKTAVHFLSTILLLPDPKSVDLATTHFALGVEYVTIAEYDLAEEHFSTAKKISKNTDYIRYAKTLGELGGLALKKGNHEQAEQLYLEDIVLSKKYGDARNTMYAQIKLADLYSKTKKWNLLKQPLIEAYEYVKDKGNILGFKQEIIQLQLQAAEHSTDLPLQLELYKKLKNINEELKYKDGQDAIMRVNLQLQRERAEWQTIANDIKLREAKLTGLGLVIICALLLGIAIALRRSKRRALKLQKVIFEKKTTEIQLEKITSESKYNQAQKTIHSYRTFLDERNKAIEMLKIEVSKLQTSHTTESGQQRHELEQLLTEHLMTDDNWHKFKRTFIREYPDHYREVKQQLIGITESQLRIVLLQKIGLRNHEMANLLGISHESIKKSRQRLRKKFGKNYDLIATPVHQQLDIKSTQ